MKAYRIKKSNIDKKGRGLYAARDIKEGEKIIDYVGKIITKKQTEGSTMQAAIFSPPKFIAILSKSSAISTPVSG